METMNPGNATIMLVGGQNAAAGMLPTCLGHASHTLISAEDGLSAREMLVADPGRYDVVVLDDASRNVDCMPLFEWMQRHPILQGVPAILQAGSVDGPGIREACRGGKFSCLQKPFEPQQLLGVLALALHKRLRYRSALDGRGNVLNTVREADFSFRTPHAARDLAALLADTCPEPQRVVVGLTELLLNAVEHGNLQISYEEKARLRGEERWEQEVAARLASPDHAGKEVWVGYRHEPDRVRILIRDQGEGFDWRSYLAMEASEAVGLHGRGIAIARTVSFDSIEYRGSGNEVEVTVDIPPR